MSDQNELPRYRATMDVHPSPNGRHRREPPFSTIFDSGCWQYAEQPLKATEEIETRAWPHPSFRALNEPARRVLQFFLDSVKSRLPISPYRNGVLHLDNGLSGPSQPQFTIRSAAGDAA